MEETKQVMTGCVTLTVLLLWSPVAKAGFACLPQTWPVNNKKISYIHIEQELN